MQHDSLHSRSCLAQLDIDKLLLQVGAEIDHAYCARFHTFCCIDRKLNYCRSRNDAAMGDYVHHLDAARHTNRVDVLHWRTAGTAGWSAAACCPHAP